MQTLGTIKSESEPKRDTPAKGTSASNSQRITKLGSDDRRRSDHDGYRVHKKSQVLVVLMARLRFNADPQFPSINGSTAVRGVVKVSLPNTTYAIRCPPQEDCG